MKYSIYNSEVLYTAEPLTLLDRGDVEHLKSLAAGNPRRRVRLCSHPGIEDHLHEMIIVHTHDVYVRPHRHLGKSESFHVIEGQLQVVFFEESGVLKQVVSMGEPGSGDVFYYRCADSWYHTVRPLSEVVVFHEATNGPFRREDTVFAPWSPTANDLEGQQIFKTRLAEDIRICLRSMVSASNDERI